MNKHSMNSMNKTLVFRITRTKVADGVAYRRRRIQEGSLMSTQLSEAAQTRKAVGNILKGSAGNLVEWYDLYVYTVFAAYFQAHFFNSTDELQAGLEAMAVFSTSFLMRPIGAWFFGRYADRKGRKAALTLSVTMMSAGSFAIAVLPTQDVIGLWALILLVLIRVIQGFSVGGEYGTSATYMSEAATSKRRGFFSSFQYVTLIGGQMLALLVLVVLQNAMPKAELTEWGWRIPFAIGGVAALVVLWLRRSMEETVSAEQIEAAKAPAVAGQAQPGTMKLLFTSYWKPLMICIGITLGGTVPLLGAAFQQAERVDLFFTYVTVAIAISLVVYIFALKNKKSTHLDHEQGHAWAPAAVDAGTGTTGPKDDDKDLVDASRR